MTLPALLAHVAARWAATRTPTCGWVPDESETEMTEHEPMTQERLDAIQARVEVATDGPWAVDSDDPSYIIHSERGGWDGLVIAQVADQDGALFPVEHNGALIANAPQDLADLLAEVERLRALTTVDKAMVERAKRAFGAATAQVSSIPLGMSEDMFIDSVGLQHQHAIRAALDAALGTEEGA